MVDGGDGVMATLFQGAEDAHQDGLTIGATLAAVAVAVLSNNDGRADDPLGMVVVERNPRLVQKREQVLAMTTKTLDEAIRLRVVPWRGDQLVEPGKQARPTRGGRFGRKVGAPREPNRIAQETPRLLGERGPVLARPSGRPPAARR